VKENHARKEKPNECSRENDDREEGLGVKNNKKKGEAPVKETTSTLTLKKERALRQTKKKKEKASKGPRG